MLHWQQHGFLAVMSCNISRQPECLCNAKAINPRVCSWNWQLIAWCVALCLLSWSQAWASGTLVQTPRPVGASTSSHSILSPSSTKPVVQGSTYSTTVCLWPWRYQLFQVPGLESYWQPWFSEPTLPCNVLIKWILEDKHKSVTSLNITFCCMYMVLAPKF